MRILTLIPGGIDEQLFFFPTLAALQQHYPQALIDVLVEPSAKPAYRICPYVHEVLAFDYQDRNGLADYLNLLGVIRDREYEIALSADDQWLIALLQWLNGIPIRVGYENQSDWFINHRVTQKTAQYRPWMYYDLLKGLGIHSPCPMPKLALPKEDIHWVESTQQQLDLKDRGYILLYGEINEDKGSTYYPIHQWKKIVDDIQQKQPDIPIVLLQLVEDVPWITKMKEGYPQLKVIQPMDMGKLAATLAGANLVICPPSVPMQLAIALETYTVVFSTRQDKMTDLPPEGDSYRVVESSSDKIADIPPETILEQIWRG